MKALISAMLVCLCSVIVAQESRDFHFSLHRAEDLKKINVVSAQDFDVVHLYLQSLDFTEAPFIAASMRLEGQGLEGDMVAVLMAKTKDLKQRFYQMMPRFHDAIDDPSSTFIGNLTYLDKSVANLHIAIKVKKPALERINSIYLRLFNPGQAQITKEGVFSPENTCPAPPSVPRTNWGGSLGLTENQFRNSPSYTNVTHLIVHHSAGANTSTNWAATVRAIFDFHVNTNGWSDVGYNYLITPDGTLFVGRGGGNNVIGAHYCAKNGNTMGVCMVGTYTTVAPTDTAMRTLEKILAWKCTDANINPTGMGILSDLGAINTINGHRSGCATECPGEMTFAALPTIRTRVAALVAACRAVTTKDLADLGTVLLSPNPVQHGKLMMKIDLKTAQPILIHGFSADGRQVFQRLLSENAVAYTTELSIGHLPRGIYFFYISVGDRFTSQKVVVE